MAKAYEPKVKTVMDRMERGMTPEPNNPTAGISEKNFLGGYVRSNRGEVDAYIDQMAKSDASASNRKRVQNLRDKVDMWAARKPILYNDGGTSFRSMRLSRDNSYSMTVPSANAVFRFLATTTVIAGLGALVYLGWQLREVLLEMNEQPVFQMRREYFNE